MTRLRDIGRAVSRTTVSAEASATGAPKLSHGKLPRRALHGPDQSLFPYVRQESGIRGIRGTDQIQQCPRQTRSEAIGALDVMDQPQSASRILRSKNLN